MIFNYFTEAREHLGDSILHFYLQRCKHSCYLAHYHPQLEGGGNMEGQNLVM